MRGRQRLVKPEIHSDAELWDAEQETGLPLFRAFVGLWGFSDREGRFEWKPRQLKALILPYWDGDFSRVLDALGTRRFIVRYASGTGVFGLVRTFRRHQSVNGRESPSELPAPPDGIEEYQYVADASATRDARVEHASGTLHDGIGRVGIGTGMVGGAGGDAPDGAAPAAQPATKPKATRKRTERDDMFDLVRDTFEAAHAAAHGVPQGVSASLVSRLVDKWVKPMAPDRRAEMVQRAVAGYFADPYWREQGKHPFGPFEASPGAFVAQAQPRRSSHNGRVSLI